MAHVVLNTLTVSKFLLSCFSICVCILLYPFFGPGVWGKSELMSTNKRMIDMLQVLRKY